MSSKIAVRGTGPLLFSLVALAGCGDKVVDATSKMDGGPTGSPTGGAASGGTPSGGASNGGTPGGGASNGGTSAGGASSGGAQIGGQGGANTAGAGGRGGRGNGGASTGGKAPSTGGNGDASAPTPDGGGDVMGVACTNPVFTTSDTNGGWSDGGYYVHNNMWNSSAGLGPETLSACSYHSWYVVSNQTNSAGAVKTYPNVHIDYSNVPISSYKTITSTFAEKSPHVGIYDVAYDIWTNGVATNGSTEFMIWTENFKQVPAGSRVKTMDFGGRTYDVWKTQDSHYIAFVPMAVFTSGTVDILEIFKWTIAQGWLPANSTLGQLDFGVEIVETGGASATFQVTDFSITTN